MPCKEENFHCELPCFLGVLFLFFHPRGQVRCYINSWLTAEKEAVM